MTSAQKYGGAEKQKESGINYDFAITGPFSDREIGAVQRMFNPRDRIQALVIRCLEAEALIKKGCPKCGANQKENRQ